MITKVPANNRLPLSESPEVESPETDTVSAAKRRARRLILLAFAIAFLPALWTGIAVGENAVNIPVWDDWERGKLLKHSVDGTLDLDYLASAHIDHRMLFPRLAVLGLNKVSGGDLRAEIWAIFVVLLLTGGCLFSCSRKRCPTGAGWRPADFS